MRHTFSVLIEKRSGEFARLVGLFSNRGFDIESLTISETAEPEISRVTLVTIGDHETMELVLDELNQQSKIHSVVNLSLAGLVEHEMALLHVQTNSWKERLEVTDLVNIFDAKIIDATASSVTIAAMAEHDRLTEFLHLLRPFGISEIARAGTLAIPRLERKRAKQATAAEDIEAL